MSQSNEQQYRVEHSTRYEYSAPAMLSHQQLHVTPRPLDYQRVHDHNLEIIPAVSHRHDLTDPFGNPLSEIAIETAHSSLKIVSRMTVNVSERAQMGSAETPPWESVRDRLTYRAAWRPDADVLDATQYLFESRHVRVKRVLRQYSADCFTPGAPVLGAAMALMAKIHKEFQFDAKATNVTTPVMKVFELKRGVCQDFAHLMISCLRSTGLAARYVSGYILTHPPPGKPRRIGADASHAWVALFIPGSGWFDLDPTNNLRPSLEHITVAWGRDFSDVTPLRGVINGGEAQKLDVKVTVQPVPSDTMRLRP